MTAKKPSRRAAGPQYLCRDCGATGALASFDAHATECMRGAPKPLPGEGFDTWSVRVAEWRATRR